jgi:hypothetical protein
MAAGPIAAKLGDASLPCICYKFRRMGHNLYLGQHEAPRKGPHSSGAVQPEGWETTKACIGILAARNVPRRTTVS